jgi:hypothetical protein
MSSTDSRRSLPRRERGSDIFKAVVLKTRKPHSTKSAFNTPVPRGFVSIHRASTEARTASYLSGAEAKVA